MVGLKVVGVSRQDVPAGVFLGVFRINTMGAFKNAVIEFIEFKLPKYWEYEQFEEMQDLLLAGDPALNSEFEEYHELTPCPFPHWAPKGLRRFKVVSRYGDEYIIEFLQHSGEYRTTVIVGGFSHYRDDKTESYAIDSIQEILERGGSMTVL